MTIQKIQDLADYLTTAALAAMYGQRFLDLEEVEDDEEINKKWDFLNEKFYDTINTSIII